MRLSDNEILEILKKDSNKGVELIFQTYYKDLCRISNRYIRDENHAEDLVQELIYDIWKKAAVLNINSSLGPYLKKSIVNRSLNHIRGKKPLVFGEDHKDDLRVTTHSAQQDLEKDELEVKIQRSIDSLPEKCRLVFVMSRFEELSYKEIAQKLEISTKTVENQISKALRILREQLDYKK